MNQHTISSRVLHAKNITLEGTLEELKKVIRMHGTIINAVMLHKFNQALIEMSTLSEAESVVNASRVSPFVIHGRRIEIGFSKSQEINQTLTKQPIIPPNRILLCTIFNIKHEITVDIIHRIMSPFGIVQRIVIFEKTVLQVLVEFDNVVSASDAKLKLNGRDIFEGACTLKIDYSKTDKLNVHENTDRTYDFTLASEEKNGNNDKENEEGLSDVPSTPAKSRLSSTNNTISPSVIVANDVVKLETNSSSLSGNSAFFYPPSFSKLPSPYLDSVFTFRPPSSTKTSPLSCVTRLNENSLIGLTVSSSPLIHSKAEKEFINSSGNGNLQTESDLKEYEKSIPATIPYNDEDEEEKEEENDADTEHRVVFVQNLPGNATNETVFNLFCIFGNINKTKLIVRTPTQSSALVEFAPTGSAYNQSLFGAQTAVRLCNTVVEKSRPPLLVTVTQSESISDEIKDEFKSMSFSHSPLNRFNSGSHIPQINYPTQSLFFTNLPKQYTEDMIKQIFTQSFAPIPIGITIFSKKNDMNQTSKFNSGLLKFETKADAVYSLYLVNNKKLEKCVLKLSFAIEDKRTGV